MGVRSGDSMSTRRPWPGYSNTRQTLLTLTDPPSRSRSNNQYGGSRQFGTLLERSRRAAGLRPPTHTTRLWTALFRTLSSDRLIWSIAATALVSVVPRVAQPRSPEILARVTVGAGVANGRHRLLYSRCHHSIQFQFSLLTEPAGVVVGVQYAPAVPYGGNRHDVFGCWRGNCVGSERERSRTSRFGIRVTSLLNQRYPLPLNPVIYRKLPSAIDRNVAPSPSPYESSLRMRHLGILLCTRNSGRLYQCVFSLTLVVLFPQSPTLTSPL